MQKHPGGRASAEECKMKDTDLAGFGRKYPKRSRYSLMCLKHQRVDRDQLDKHKYVTEKKFMLTDTHRHRDTKKQKGIDSYLKPGCHYNTMMFAKS